MKMEYKTTTQNKLFTLMEANDTLIYVAPIAEQLLRTSLNLKIVDADISYNKINHVPFFREIALYEKLSRDVRRYNSYLDEVGIEGLIDFDKKNIELRYPTIMYGLDAYFLWNFCMNHSSSQNQSQLITKENIEIKEWAYKDHENPILIESVYPGSDHRIPLYVSKSRRWNSEQ